MSRVISNEVYVLNCYSGSWMENEIDSRQVCVCMWVAVVGGVLFPVSWTSSKMVVALSQSSTFTR